MNTDRPSRILVFNVNWLGDVLFSTPVIRNIRRNYPEAFIACVVPQRCRQILEGNPYLNEILTFDERTTHRGLLARARFIGELRRRRFDTVFLLHRSMSRALMCLLAGIPRRVGHTTNKRAFLLTTKIIPPDVRKVHRSDYYLSVIEGAGLKIADRHLDYAVADGDRAFAADFLRRHGLDKGGPLVVLNPGGNWMPKRWPAQNWAAVADAAAGEFGARIVINGGPQDSPLIDEIRGLMKTPAVSCERAFNLKHAGALAQMSDLFITADTGPLHIAVAAGAKNIIAVFGPTLPELTGPRPAARARVVRKDIGCKLPCFEVDCPDNRCMRAVSPADVLAQVRGILHKPESASRE